jgi:hypothetical protein
MALSLLFPPRPQQGLFIFPPRWKPMQGWTVLSSRRRTDGGTTARSRKKLNYAIFRGEKARREAREEGDRQEGSCYKYWCFKATSEYTLIKYCRYRDNRYQGPVQHFKR